MPYFVKEIFYTLQGEGAQVGRPVVFCRFTGCNLWSGREADRSKAICRFCDTDFIGIDGPGGGRFNSPGDLAVAVAEPFPRAKSSRILPMVVCTGGEPLLQLDEGLIRAFHDFGFEVAVETNGTLLPPPGIDWICVSPKVGSVLNLRSGDELKLVFPKKASNRKTWNRLISKFSFCSPKTVLISNKTPNWPSAIVSNTLNGASVYRCIS
jgi:7-carboxy-7-deazaguanine synthase